MKHSTKSGSTKKEQHLFAWVAFTNEDGTVMSLDIFRDLQDAYDFFEKEVKEEFEGIRRDFPGATNFQESIDKTEATMTWDYSAWAIIKENHIWNPLRMLRVLFNRNKYCHHLCHAVVEDSWVK